MSRIEQFEKMLHQGQDGALLRFSLGREYLNAAQPEAAIPHLQQAIAQDAGYSAAYRALGEAYVAAGQPAAAANIYRTGIDVAEGRGDKQAAKEMRVFLKRAEKAAGAGGGADG